MVKNGMGKVIFEATMGWMRAFIQDIISWESG